MTRVFIFGLISGFSLCWFLFIEKEPSWVITPIPAESQPLTVQPAARGKSATHDLQQLTLTLIQTEQVDATITLLNQLNDEEQVFQGAYQQLEHHLITLQHKSHWEQLQVWIDTLLANGFSNARLYQYKADIHQHYGQYVQAIEALYAARFFSTSYEAAEVVSNTIDSMMSKLLNRYKENDLSVSRQMLLDVLAIAWEKQPDHPPVGLAYARFYEMEKAYGKAIEYLRLVPYDEAYAVEVSTALKALQRLLAEQQPVINSPLPSIPLTRHGNQFSAEVIINDHTSLQLLLDTGANTSAIALPIIKQLDDDSGVRRLDKRVWLTTANGQAEAEVYQVDNLLLGEYRFNDIALISINMGNSDRVDGLLGMDILGQFEFEINQRESILYLSPRKE